jgi:hypothetical protein
MSHILTGKINHKFEEVYSPVVHKILLACKYSYLLGNTRLIRYSTIQNSWANGRTGWVLEPCPAFFQTPMVHVKGWKIQQ